MNKNYAIRFAEEIIDYEEFDLTVVEATEEDECVKEGDCKVGQKVFALEDSTGANLADIESERFENLAEVIGRLETYHHDYLPAFEGGGECTEMLAFLDDDEAYKLLVESTPEDYEAAFSEAKKIQDEFFGLRVTKNDNEDRNEYFLAEPFMDFAVGTSVDDVVEKVHETYCVSLWRHVCVLQTHNEYVIMAA